MKGSPVLFIIAILIQGAILGCKPTQTTMQTNTTSPVSISDTTQENVLIPDYLPLDVPHSEWKPLRHKELLELNNVSLDTAGLISGTQRFAPLLREASLFLLSQSPDSSLLNVYTSSLEDEHPAVKSLAAYSLVKLGDSSKIEILKSLILPKNNPGISIYLSAALLGKLGEPTSFKLFQTALDHSEQYIRIMSLDYAHYFFEIRDQIEFWEYFSKASSHPDDRVRLIARMQLEEFDTEASRQILQDMK